MASIEEWVNYETHRNAADTYSIIARHSPAEANAFAHAYLSAMITYENSAKIAQTLGDIREFRTTWDYYWGDGGEWRYDTYRDLYNNMVGRSIGVYVKDNAISSDLIAALVDDALNSGALIISISTGNLDPRLPEKLYMPFWYDLAKFDLPGFSGWPADFYIDGPANPWAGPSNAWRGECFPASTEISLALNKTKSIENIRVGDRVLAYEKAISALLTD